MQDIIEKYKYIEKFFDKDFSNAEVAINVKLVAQMLASVQTMIQEEDFGKKFEDMSIEDICEHLAKCAGIE